MLKDFEKTLVFFSLFFFSFGLFIISPSLPSQPQTLSPSEVISNLGRTSRYIPSPVFAPLRTRAFRPALTYLPGVLDLRGEGTAVLGTESEVDPKEVVRYVNLERKKAGASELIISPALEQAAQMRADVMLKYQNPSHQDPYENIILTTALPKVGYSYSYASENIALAQGNSAGFVNGWMNSSSHRQNLLDTQLKETGVGVTSGKVGDYYVTIAVQLFATPTPVEQYRGYNDGDIENVGKLLSGVETELARTNSYLGNGNSVYYLGWKQILQKQKEILTLVLAYMRTGQAYTQEQYNLIAEYNGNWEKIPEKAQN